MNQYIIAQIIGYLALAISSFAFWQVSRKKLLYVRIVSDFLYGIHFILISALTGGIFYFIGMIREFVFSLKEKYKWLRSIFVLFFFYIVSTSGVIFTFSGWYDLIAIASNIIFTTSVWIDNLKNIKLFAILASSLWLVYAFCVKSYPAMISETIFLVSTIASYLYSCFSKNKKLEVKIKEIK
ncbi:MAG: YgjV family protein [Spirochaetales bacterium]